MLFVARDEFGILLPLRRRRQGLPERLVLLGPWSHSMASYDFVMIFVLAATTLWGLWKGLAWQIASLTAVVASYCVAIRFSESLAPTFGTQAPLNRFVAMFALYMGTSLVVWVLFHFVKDFIGRLRLQEFDRQIGAVVGAAKGVLFCIVITFFAVTLVPSGRDSVLHSNSGHYIALLLNRADPVIPSEIHDVLDPYLNRLETELQPDGAKPPPATSKLLPATGASRSGS
jgi:membrane protein required for colicin V production